MSSSSSSLGLALGLTALVVLRDGVARAAVLEGAGDDENRPSESTGATMSVILVSGSVRVAGTGEPMRGPQVVFLP